MGIPDIRIVCVLGTGNMGPGISVLFALAGCRVFLWAHSDRGLEKGAADAKRNLEEMAAHGVVDSQAAQAARERIEITTDLARAAGDADFISESVREDLQLKRELYATVEALCPERAIIASNTSTLLPTLLQEGMRRPERLVVAHFWNPAHLVPLVEVCGGAGTSPEAVDATMRLLERAGKTPVRMRKEVLGFLGNRLMHAMYREACALVARGVAEAGDIDRVVLSSFGPRFANLGPMEYLDFVGLDLIKSVQHYLYGDLDRTPGIMPLVERLNAEGALGMKTGRGLFDWKDRTADDIRRRRDMEFYRRMGPG